MSRNEKKEASSLSKEAENVKKNFSKEETIKDTKAVSKQDGNEENKKSSEKVDDKSERKAITKKPVEKKKPPTKKTKKKPNYILWAGLIVLLIPCLILLYIILGSRENSGEPIVGDRFDQAMEPAISESQRVELKEALAFEHVENVEVTLKSATLRITLNAKDDASADTIESLMNQAYDIVVEKLPVETYFTNQKQGDKILKMYDLQINAYNFIPETPEDKSSQIQMIRTKNAAAESDVVDVVSSPKNEDAANAILNPDTTNIPDEETKEDE